MFCFGIKPQQNPFEKVGSAIETGLRSNVKKQPLSAGYSLFCNCCETQVKEFDGTTFWHGAGGVGHSQNNPLHKPLN